MKWIFLLFWGKQRIRIKKTSKAIDDKIEISKSISTNENIEKKYISNNENSQNDINLINRDEEKVINEENLLYISAPLVGTYYQSSKPGEPPFISIGDKVNKGQTICIIEAMKIFNEIEAEVTGIVKEILVDDGTPVEFNQKLVIITQE